MLRSISFSRALRTPSHQLGDAGGSLTGPGRARKVVAVSCPERRHEPELPPELSRQARYLVPREFADAGPSQQTMPLISLAYCLADNRLASKRKPLFGSMMATLTSPLDPVTTISDTGQERHIASGSQEKGANALAGRTAADRSRFDATFVAFGWGKASSSATCLRT